MGKILTALFKMILQQDINKLSLISLLVMFYWKSFKLKLKSLKSMLQSQVRMRSEIADCLTFLMQNSHMFICSDVKMAFSFPVINSVSAITLKTKQCQSRDF